MQNDLGSDLGSDNDFDDIKIHIVNMTQFQKEYLCIPKRFWNVSFRFIQDHKAKTVVYKFVTNINKMIDDGAILSIYGPTNTGKTSLAVVILASALASGRKGLFISAYDLQRFIDKEILINDEDAEDRAMRADVLVIDDFGNEYISEKWGRRDAHVIRILHERSRKGKTSIVVSSNTLEKELKNHPGNLHVGCDIIKSIFHLHMDKEYIKSSEVSNFQDILGAQND